MSSEMLMREFFFLAIAGAIAFSIYSKDSLEREPGREIGNRQRYMPYIPAYVFPLFLAVLLVFSTARLGLRTTLEEIAALCFDVFIHISLYYLVLLLALPLLRRYISSRTCAALWIIPNYLYVIWTSGWTIPRPLAVLRIPSNIVKPLCILWGAGFAGVLVWKVLSHLHFRHTVLKNAYAVTDPAILELWKAEQESAGFQKGNFPLVYSPQIHTPLSIGFFRRSIRVVLPERSYTPGELALVFRHELVHIGREDSTSKFFMTFCTAMCWFNPLMWVAVRRSADDMELSCDETVLLDADQNTRRQYAQLLLRTAGDDRGFSTCLSASANTMRYRLKHVITPRKRFVGGITAGLIFFGLIMTCGHIALAYGEGTGQQYIFGGVDPWQYPVRSISRHDTDGYRFYDCTDEAALNTYLSGLTLYEITGNYSFPEEEHGITVMYYGPYGVFGVTLRDGALSTTSLYGERPSSSSYYCPEQIDWAFLDSLLTVQEESGLPHPPEMQMYFNEEINPDGHLMYANRTVLTQTVDGKLVQPQTEPVYDEPGFGGVSGYPVSQVKLYFSHPMKHGYTVFVEDWSGAPTYTIHSSELEEADILPLAPYSARYRVSTTMYDEVDDEVYQMEFRFEVELPKL